jgi:hypothetical protein
MGVARRPLSVVNNLGPLDPGRMHRGTDGGNLLCSHRIRAPLSRKGALNVWTRSPGSKGDGYSVAGSEMNSISDAWITAAFSKGAYHSSPCASSDAWSRSASTNSRTWPVTRTGVPG